MNPLEKLGDKWRPTKRIAGYLPYYFRDLRETVRNVLEIGVQEGRSMRMWEEFFPNATIWGLDIDPACQKAAGGRRRLIIGHQSDGKVLRRVVQEADGPLDVVIDDGSHRVHHQIATFRYLFPQLSDHGVYSVEDLGPNAGDWALDAPRYFQKMVDHVMYWPPEIHPENWPRPFVGARHRPSSPPLMLESKEAPR